MKYSKDELEKMTLKQKEEVATKEDTCYDTLKILASYSNSSILKCIMDNKALESSNSKVPEVKRVIVKNPSATLEILRLFLTEGEGEIIQEALASREDITEDMLDKLGDSKKCSVRQNVARNNTTTDRILLRLARDECTMRGVSGNENASENTLIAIVKSLKSPELIHLEENTLINISSHKNSTSKVLQLVTNKALRLTPHCSLECLKSIAKNKNTPDTTLRRLARVNCINVRQAVACNKNISVKTLEKLVGISGIFVKLIIDLGLWKGRSSEGMHEFALRNIIIGNDKATKTIARIILSDDNPHLVSWVSKNRDLIKERFNL